MLSINRLALARSGIAPIRVLAATYATGTEGFKRGSAPRMHGPVDTGASKENRYGESQPSSGVSKKPENNSAVQDDESVFSKAASTFAEAAKAAASTVEDTLSKGVDKAAKAIGLKEDNDTRTSELQRENDPAGGMERTPVYNMEGKESDQIVMDNLKDGFRHAADKVKGGIDSAADMAGFQQYNNQSATDSLKENAQYAADKLKDATSKMNTENAKDTVKHGMEYVSDTVKSGLHKAAEAVGMEGSSGNLKKAIDEAKEKIKTYAHDSGMDGAADAMGRSDTSKNIKHGMRQATDKVKSGMHQAAQSVGLEEPHTHNALGQAAQTKRARAFSPDSTEKTWANSSKDSGDSSKFLNAESRGLNENPEMMNSSSSQNRDNAPFVAGVGQSNTQTGATNSKPEIDGWRESSQRMEAKALGTAKSGKSKKEPLRKNVDATRSTHGYGGQSKA